jgi:hypothetical protein
MLLVSTAVVCVWKMAKSLHPFFVVRLIPRSYRGHADRQHKYGMPKQVVAAVDYCQLAADQGQRLVHVESGRCFEDGIGLTQD